jgi:hypothetical protein
MISKQSGIVDRGVAYTTLDGDADAIGLKRAA